ncbi:hypothetical protein T492DRAFT_859611 [Pavlovales sp. CCMP2436]|nr:hypothetical protein T492DRAFT_859611 [Pavlovales sp. CCMP2436]
MARHGEAGAKSQQLRAQAVRVGDESTHLPFKLAPKTADAARTGTGNGGGKRTDSDDDGNPDEWAEGAYHLRRETRFGIGA